MRRLSHLVAVTCLALAVAGLGVDAPDAQAQQEDRVRVLHVTLDALHPSQIGAHTPFLQQLKESGTWWEQARAVMAAETLPNHVAMGTGTYPARNGIPGNDGRAEPGDQAPAEPDLGQPQLLEAASFARTIEDVCPELRTVHVFSKEYVDNIFEADPVDARFPQEQFNIPGSGHAPDTSTVGYILQEFGQNEFDYLFANLGDIDRAGHVDATGVTSAPLEQLAAIEQTDKLVESMVQSLRQRGLWDSTVLVISSDHSMDWSPAGDPSANVDLQAALDADPRTQGRFFTSANGGAGLVYLLDPSAEDAGEVLAAGREILSGLDGVAEALYRLPNPVDPGHDLATVHPAWRLEGTHRAGEIFVHVTDGRRVGSLDDNPIPGNHGHGITRHVTALVTGGWDGLAQPRSVPPSDPDAVNVVDDTAALPEQVEQVDYAPTFGWLLGVPDPGSIGGGEGQWQGRVLTEAFARQPDPVCVEPATVDEPSPAMTPPPSSERGDTGGDPDGQGLPATGGGLVISGVLALSGAAVLLRRRWRA